MVPLVGLISGPARQLLARRRIDARLTFLGLPSSRRTCVKVPEACVASCVKHMIRRAVSESSLLVYHKKWLLSRVTVMAAASRAFLSERGTSKAAPAAEPHDVLKWSNSELSRAMTGSGMKFVPER